MKHFVLILSLLLISIAGFGQKIRFTDTANRWQSSAFDGSGGPMITHLYYSISGDSIISGVIYRKMLVNGNNRYLVRDDTANNKVYYRSNDTDYILYNYNLHVGDTIHYKGALSSMNDSIVRIDSVLKIDSVYYFGAYYKIFTLKTIQKNSQFSFTYVEGIGSFYGPMFPFTFPHFEQSEILRCFSRSGITDTTSIHYSAAVSGSTFLQPMVYKNNCNFLNANNITSIKNEVNISPNPCSYQTTITLNDIWGANASVKIFDMTGRCLYNITPRAGLGQQVINTSNLNPGMYLITIQRGDAKTNAKLIVQ